MSDFTSEKFLGTVRYFFYVFFIIDFLCDHSIFVVENERKASDSERLKKVLFPAKQLCGERFMAAVPYALLTKKLKDRNKNKMKNRSAALPFI